MDRSGERYEQQKARSRKWKQCNKERHAELARAYRQRNKDKTTAQNKLNYAVRTGKMERKSCEVCGTAEMVHAHHHDYTKPYDVKWLCYACHKSAHPVSEENKAIKFHSAKHAILNGSENPFSKLTGKDVVQIRKLLDAGISQQRIAQLFGVSQFNISRIKRGVLWSHIK